MKITKNELISIVAQFNPWWKNEKIPDLPTWKRSLFLELMKWIQEPPTQRAILLSGARQVGKTTLILQAIENLLASGVPSSNILYITFDHPICKLEGLEAILEVWRELEPQKKGPEYLFLDEAQHIPNIGTWTKHQVDFFKNKRIIFTGSATPRIQKNEESGVGRWHTIEIGPLSFYEYLQLKNIELPSIPSFPSIQSLHNSSPKEKLLLKELSSFLIGHFHEYLIRGGFPQTTVIESITQAQKLLREDILDKVLKRDMTALFGVRRIHELEQMFIFLCLHDGGIQDMQAISRDLGISKNTVQNFVDLFETTYLIHKLPPYGYGKAILRGKNKIYLNDPAIPSAVLLKGKTTLENSHALGHCVETAVINHLHAHCKTYQARLSYYRGQKDKEVDCIVELNGLTVPFEVKYQTQPIKKRDIQGLIEFMKQKPTIPCGYIISKTYTELEPIENKKYITIPAPLFCYMIGKAALRQQPFL